MSKGLVAAVLSLLFAVLASCGGTLATQGPTTTPARSPGAVVQVTQHEYAITANPASVAAGEVTFQVSNNGTLEHEFIILGPTGLAPDQLPSDDGGQTVDEEEVGVAMEWEGIKAGSGGTFATGLDAGNYVLLCNIPTHYSSGMRVAFTVH